MRLTTYHHLAQNFKHEWSYNAGTPPACLHGMYRENFTFTFYLSKIFQQHCLGHGPVCDMMTAFS